MRGCYKISLRSTLPLITAALIVHHYRYYITNKQKRMLLVPHLPSQQLMGFLTVLSCSLSLALSPTEYLFLAGVETLEQGASLFSF